MCESYELYESAFNLCGEFHIMGVTFHEILDISIFGAIMGTRRGGARVGGRPLPPPPGKYKNPNFFSIWGPFSYFFAFMGGLFGACPPPPRKFLRAPMGAMHFIYYINRSI